MGEFLRVSPNIPIGFANVGGCCSCCTYMKKKGNGALPEHEVLVRQGAVDRFPNMKQTEFWGATVSKQYISCLGQSIFLDTTNTHTPPTECGLKSSEEAATAVNANIDFAKWLNFL